MNRASPLTLATLCLGFAIVLLAVGFAVRARFRLTRPFTWNRPSLSAEQYQALASRPGWAAAAVQVEEGVALRGLSRPPRAPARPWILFYQGNSNDRQLGEGQQFLEALAQGDDLGLAVVAWRGYDGSPGKPSGANLLSDAEAIYRWARTSARGPVHLIGFSLGTLPAAYVAARDPAAPASVALLAPFTQIQMVHPRAFARSLLADRLDEVPDLAHLGSARPQVPALVLHGDADPVLPVEMGRAAAAAVGTSARLVVLPGAGHAELLGDARALRELRLHLGLPPGP